MVTAVTDEDNEDGDDNEVGEVGEVGDSAASARSPSRHGTTSPGATTHPGALRSSNSGRFQLAGSAPDVVETDDACDRPCPPLCVPAAAAHGGFRAEGGPPGTGGRAGEAANTFNDRTATEIDAEVWVGKSTARPRVSATTEVVPSTIAETTVQSKTIAEAVLDARTRPLRLFLQATT